MESNTFNRLDYAYKLLVVMALCVTALVLAKDLFIPLAFAGFFAVVMSPLVKWLEQRNVNMVLAVTLVLLGFTLALGLLIWLIVDQLIALINDLPDIESQLDAFIKRISRLLRNDFGISVSEQNTYVKEALKTVSTYAGELLLSTTNALSLVIQVPIYIFLFLIYREKFRLFFSQIVPGLEAQAWKKDLEGVLQGYISGLALVTVIIATLNTLGLLILGIEHAVFFGILSGLLTVIPYIGIFIGATLPVILALITKDNAWYAVGVVGIFSVVQFLEGNFITPRITGSKVSINALAAIIALVIGGMVLGIAGMILAVPAIGVLKIFLQHSDRLRPFVILLEDDTKPKKDEETPPMDSSVMPEVDTSKNA
ncbi:MAG: AI-2E family transporter [Cyclobacteriaceae bacterium]|jgi:predicted PurR-regulated permease PerM|nr:AI-2E family transporter [Cyclobacteriaceae bacterium]